MKQIASGALSAAITPLGAELSRLTTAAGAELLWDGDPAFWTGRAPILFPIVGALNHGSYALAGKHYALSKHGFARTSTFEVVAHEGDRVCFRLEDSPATRAAYPFAFRLEIAFRLDGLTLETTATVENCGDAPMPVSFGFHPAFRWPLPFGGIRADHTVTFEQDEPEPIRRLGSDGMIDRQAFPTPVEGRTLRLRDELFENDAIIFDRLRSRSLRYGAPGERGLAVSFDNLPDLGIWTKPGAGYICLEPWQGYNDPSDFEGSIFDKPGIVALPPGRSRDFRLTVTVDA